MHQIIFIASTEAVGSLESDDNPAEEFPCMSSQQFHKDARAQLYVLVLNKFLDEAISLEQLYRTMSYDGPFIYQLSPDLTEGLARLEEDQIGEVALSWLDCAEIEQLDVDTNDLHEFMFQFVHFCQIAVNDDLSIFLYSDD